MSGSIWMPPGARPDTLPVIPHQRTRPSWARPDPVDELAARLDDFIAAAVHPDEIAALLESDGLSDDQIRERYGVRNSFALAEELYERGERRYPEPDGPVPDPWQVGLLGCLLRGLVFALPGLGYVLGAPLLAGPRDDFGLPAGTVPLLAGALCGWTWNQGLAHRAYSWLGLGDRAAARRSLLAGAPAGALLGALVAFAVTGTAAPTALAFAVGQSCYLGAATVLLVMGRERALLAALLPMAAGAVLALVHPVPDAARLVLLLVSLAAVAFLGLREVAPLKGRGELRDQPPRTRRQPTTTAPHLTASLPYALFGLATGTLVLYAAVGDTSAAVALTLSMGPAEWLLYRFRSGSLAGLRSSSTPRAFRRATAFTVVECLAVYLAALLALTLATGVTDVRLADLLLLGVVLWTGLLLQSFGAVLGAAAVCSAAALAQTIALAAHPGSPHWIGPIVHGTAAITQAALVCALLGRATAHR
ncbi:hypothetical protein IM697_10975 [Streptomyces ferrugineus]|uniref:Uncharacterized protein n=1 Tax=Streptomyces ferrugineus TaxID=1413221 RepID=A0A7M2SR76_9ACTN|nr:hypothetical protein [Streptomyces ferrugineus]QOV38846.1 hypothetical protein IM697_10975 [Streptomyces ferrugineus]